MSILCVVHFQLSRKVLLMFAPFLLFMNTLSLLQSKKFQFKLFNFDTSFTIFIIAGAVIFGLYKLVNISCAIFYLVYCYTCAELVEV